MKILEYIFMSLCLALSFNDIETNKGNAWLGAAIVAFYCLVEVFFFEKIFKTGQHRILLSSLCTIAIVILICLICIVIGEIVCKI